MAKEGMTVLFDPITTSRAIYVPMIAPIFTLSESESYDSMDDHEFHELTKSLAESISTTV